MAPIHVLMLERDPERREALLGMLRSAGHHAVAAPDAPAAAAAIGLPGFDALLLDLGLPDLDVARLREALAPAVPAAPDSLEAAERRHIALMLRHTCGNNRQAAHLLGISRSTLLHKVRKYGLGVRVLVTLRGTLAIHGVTRDVALPGYVRREGQDVRVRSDFPLNLKDYKIGGLSKALGLLKMDEHITVHVDVSFAPGP